MKTYKGPLSYYNGENDIPKGTFRISASGVSRFFSNTSQWWRENKLGEEGFQGSTASVLGTCVHYIAEMYAIHQTMTTEHKDNIEEYIESFTNPEYDTFDPEIDGQIIRYQYPIMGMAVVNDYLVHNMPAQVEPFVAEEILPNIFAGGSIDNVTNNGKTQPGIIVDYKTTGALNAPVTISYPYRLQLLTYAYLMTKRGYTIDRIRIVFVTRNAVGRMSEKTGKPLKDYPAKVTELTEQIGQEDLDMIEGILGLIAESVDIWDKQPELRHIIAQDGRLKV